MLGHGSVTSTLAAVLTIEVRVPMYIYILDGTFIIISDILIGASYVLETVPASELQYVLYFMSHVADML